MLTIIKSPIIGSRKTTLTEILRSAYAVLREQGFEIDFDCLKASTEMLYKSTDQTPTSYVFMPAVRALQVDGFTFNNSCLFQSAEIIHSNNV